MTWNAICPRCGYKLKYHSGAKDIDIAKCLNPERNHAVITLNLPVPLDLIEEINIRELPLNDLNDLILKTKYYCYNCGARLFPFDYYCWKCGRRNK